MSVDSLRYMLEELRNSIQFITERTGFSSHSSHIKNLYNKFNDAMKLNEFTKANQIESELKEIQSKCSKDNIFAKKTVNMTRPDLINDLLKAHEKCGESVAYFSKTNFGSVDKMKRAYDDAVKDIDTLNDVFDEVFSFKDNVSLVFATNAYLHILKEIKSFDNYIDVIDDILRPIIDDEEIIIDFNNIRKDLDSNTEEIDSLSDKITIIHRRFEKIDSVMTAYYSISIKIYGKLFGMIKHHVETYSDK